jgi:glycosyltransferase involved in cell wall biosynthesis
VVLLEAMSAGLACVVSDVGAMPEVVQDGVNGRVVRSGDAAALEATLAQVLSDPAERQRLGQAARETAVERYGSNAYACGLEEILLEAQGSE